MITLLLWLLCFAVIVYAVKLVLDLIPLPAPIKTIAYLILGLIALVALLQHFGMAGGL